MLLVGALILRLLFLLINATTPLVSDALYYDGVANAIVQGYDYEPYWPPGLTHYLAAWKVAFGFDSWVSRLAMLPWFIVVAIAVRSMLRRLSGNLPANLAMLFLGCSPALIHHSTEPLSQLPTAALLALAFDQYLRFREHRAISPVLLSGLFLALAVLFRPSCFLLAVLWPLCCAWRRPRFAAALIPIAVIVPLVLNFLLQKHERFVFFNDATARNVYLGNNPWTHWYKTWYYGSHWTMSPLNPPGLLTELEAIHEYPIYERNSAYWAATSRHIRDEPGMFMVRTSSRMRTFFAADSFTGSRLVNQGHPVVGYFTLALDGLLYLLVMALALRWIFLTPRPPRPFLRRDFLILIMLYALPYFFSFSHPTYHLPLMPILICFAALAGTAWMQGDEKTATMGDPIKGGKRWRIAVAILLLVQLEWVVQMAT